MDKVINDLMEVQCTHYNTVAYEEPATYYINRSNVVAICEGFHGSTCLRLINGDACTLDLPFMSFKAMFEYANS